MGEGMINGRLVHTDALKPSDIPGDASDQDMADCKSKACKRAKQRLIPARNEILTLCANLKAKENQRNIYLGSVAVFMAIAAALSSAAGAAAATIIGIPASIVLLIAAAAMITAAIAFFIAAIAVQAEMARIKSQIGVLQSEWQMLVAQIMDACAEYCWPDLEVPTCR